MNARDLALIQIDRTRLPGWSEQLRGRRADLTTADPRDRGLAEQITIGVVKNLFLLRYLIEHHSGRELKSIDEIVQKILAIALYQLRFLDRIPPSAAVDEAVEQTRRFKQGRAAGFVNAVLRNALRNPDPDDMPDEIRFSHPAPLLARLRQLLGDERAIEFCKHDNAEPPTIVRLFAGVSPAALDAPGVTISEHGLAGLFVVEGAKQPTLADWARRGLAQVQDPTAARAAEACDVRPGHRVLDRCAGLGTKTLQLRDRAGDGGEVVAIDPNKRRCEALIELARHRGVADNVHVITRGWMSEVEERHRRPFDRVLVDVPCSNSGVLARRPEARYAQDEPALRSLRDLQVKLLDDTAPFVKPGGLLVYSTCSVWPDENEAVVDGFLKRDTRFARVNQHSTLPSFGDDPTRYHDGGFFSVLRRS